MTSLHVMYTCFNTTKFKDFSMDNVRWPGIMYIILIHDATFANLEPSLKSTTNDVVN